MRLFIFAIGGTGARVLKSLGMLLAAGVKPLDPATGREMEEFEIVPMILDPHHSNEDLKRTDELLRSYRKLRRALYGGSAAAKGFFATKISTLKELLSESSSELDDTFLFNLGAVERCKFSEFVGFNDLDGENQALLRMLFSADQLDTSMNIGFVGSPNIGSVALNMFRKSPEFRAFCNVFAEGDRVFFISSIFGGTGAAGFPILLKNIRHAEGLDVNNKGYLKRCKTGALTMLPYFNIEHKEGSPINKADFVVKTRSALHYYDKAVTGSGRGSLLNAIYYLGDTEVSAPYANDPGAGGQKNAAHLVELVGALAPLNFAATPDDDLPQGRTEAFEYGLEKDTSQVNMLTFGPATRRMAATPLIKLHLLSLFLDNKFRECIGRGFTKDKPSIGSDFLSSDFYRTLTGPFLSKYWDWLEEMYANHRHVEIFDLDVASDLERLLPGVEQKKGFLGNRRFTHDDIFSRINTVSKHREGAFRPDQLPLKLMSLFYEAAGQLVESKFSNITE